MKRIVIFLCLFFSIATVSYAQEVTVSGTVRDTRGEPVIGAAVMLDGKGGVGTVTDTEGRFSIKVSDASSARFAVSSLSFKELKIDVRGRANLDIVLQDDSKLLDEVVVVGYGSMRRSDLTGAVTSVRIEEEDAARASSLDQLIQGRAAGVQITTDSFSPDAGVNIQIRGTGSFNSSRQPLFVVDGIIISGGSQQSSLLSIGTDSNESDQQSNGLMGINTQDIANVEILKDASATAIFGSEGANGVVLITTKGAARDKPSINVSIGTNIGFRTKRMPTLLFDEYCDFRSARGVSMSEIYDEQGNALVSPVDWQQYSMRPSFTQRYYISASGRPGKVSYFISAGYNANDGLLKTTGYESYTGRVNLDITLSKKLRMGVKSNYSYTHTNMTQATALQQSAAASFTRSILSYPPYLKNGGDEDVIELDLNQIAGPDKWIKDFVNSKDRFRVIPSFWLNWKINDIFAFKVNVGGEYSLTSSDRFKSIRLSSATGTSGARSRGLSGSYNADITLEANKTFKGGHRLSGVIGPSLSHRYTQTESILGWNYEQYKAKMAAVNSAENTRANYYESGSSLASALMRVIYNYKERYVLTSTLRLDGSSRFMDSNKFSFFPSFAFAWRLSEESWFNVKNISQVKLRLGWGQVGNQNIGNYKTSQNYTASTISTHYNDPVYSMPVLWRNNIPNPDLKWETTEQSNLGLDLGFFRGRVSMSVEAYYKKTYDLLQNMTIANSSGFSSVPVNNGSIRNAGVELTADAVLLKLSNGFEWSAGGNISFNRNKILSIGADKTTEEIRMADGKLHRTSYYKGSQLSSTTEFLNIFAEGQPAGVFYGYVFDGIVQLGETAPGFGDTPRTAGQIRYKDFDGNGIINENDKCVIGDPNPDFIYGFRTSVSLRRFKVAAVFSGSFGNDIYNMNHIMDYDVSSTSSNILQQAYRNAWREDRPSNVWPGLGCVETIDKSVNSSRFVEDASYLRLSNLSVSYDVPIKYSGRKVLKGVNLSAGVQNLFVLTRYSGWDPEVNSFGTNLARVGVDSNSYPQVRSFIFDAKFRF